VNLEILNTADELAEAAARSIVTIASHALSVKNNFTIALSGGSTPKRLYELLANPKKEFRSQMPWENTIFFWTDERHVSPDHADSNYRMTNEAMLSHVPVPGTNVHRFLAELSNAEAVATNYELQLSDGFDGSLPRFDLILLGLGTDGHTASLFPGTTALAEVKTWVVAPWVEKFKSFRLTMTLPVLNNAAAVMFLVSGDDKASILRDVLSEGLPRFPAQQINPTNGELTWLVDRAAASKLGNLE
jgi:6-phosphogluconolactonase